MYDTLETLWNNSPLLEWTMFIAIGIAIERCAVPGRAEGKSSAALNLVNAVFVGVASLILGPLISALVALFVISLGAGVIHPAFFYDDGLLPRIATIIFYIFCFDFVFYFWHRAQHRYPVLWHLHAVHHSDTYFNVTTYARQHWLEMIAQAVFVTVPIALVFRFSPDTYIMGGLVMAAWSFFTHMNIRMDFGRFTMVLAGPQYHRLHHSVEKKHHDINFVQYFPVIDRIFSTYVPPEKGEYPPTGLSSGETMDTPADLFFWPLRKWAKMLRRRRKLARE